MAHGSEQGMEKGRGEGLGLYRGAAVAYKERERGRFGAFHTWAPMAFHTGCAINGGEKRKERRRGRKGK